MKELFEGERAVKTDAGGQAAGDRDSTGDPRKKNGRCRLSSVVSPGHKRQVTERLVACGQCSMRAGCRYFRLHRCTYAYKGKHPDAWLMKLKAAVRRLSRQYARWGYPKITKLLKDVGAGVFPPGCRPRPNIPVRFGPGILSTTKRSAVAV